MAEFRIRDTNTATDYDYMADAVQVERRILNACIDTFQDGTREFTFDDALVVITIQGVWTVPPGKSHSKSAEDVFEIAVDEAVNDRAVKITPDLTNNSGVTVDCFPVIDESPMFYNTQQGVNQLQRKTVFESSSTFDNTASIWDDLKGLTDVL